MDEVFGENNFCNLITFKKTGGLISDFLPSTGDYLIWYCRRKDQAKFYQPYMPKAFGGDSDYQHVRLPDLTVRRLTRDEAVRPDALPPEYKILQTTSLESANPLFDFEFRDRTFSQRWKTNLTGLGRLARADRLFEATQKLRYLRLVDDFPVIPIINNWDDTGSSGYRDANIYVVQTVAKVIERCILMTTDPGDLVIDPTCGSGTTAYVAEQWGRRWITIDTSRVALALARTRLMSARYPYYLLTDSPEGRAKEQEITKRVLVDAPTHKDVRQGFVYERVPHITLKAIANNAEVDVIWETAQRTLEPLRDALNKQLGRNEPWEEWQIPRAAADPWPDEAAKQHAIAIDEKNADRKRNTALVKVNTILGRAYTRDTLPEIPFDPWTDKEAIKLHAAWWEARIARQKEIDASIARAADVEYLYDRPYVDNARVRVAGPFTVESLSPHRVVTSRDDSLGDEIAAEHGEFQRGPKNAPEADFGVMVLDHLRTAGVHQKDKADSIRFSSLEPWPGKWVAAEGRYTAEDGRERRAAVFIGPEFGSLTRTDITAAAREASDARFDALITCAFSYDAHASDLTRLGPLPILKARMNPDLHMAGDLKNTGKGNLFVLFGEPDIELLEEPDGQMRVKVHGIDVFDPATGEIRADDTKGIACWFIDTDYNEESFFVRHAYFLGANDPYQSLKTALRDEINEDAWASLYSETSRLFPRPSTGRIAVKIINHFGDEVLKVFGV